MSRFVMKAIRAATTTTLIVGSIYVQHVVRAQQSANGQAELKLTGGIGSQPATYIIESGKPFVTFLR
jgi:hypothetical protein